MRDFFPILNQEVNGHPLIYLDNAATMQMPAAVSERMESFYHTSNANIHRGIHSLSERATAEYESARETVRKFLDAESAEEIVFTSGTTASINMAALMLEPLLENGDEILVTGMEHHSNLLPWMELAKRKHLKLCVASVRENGTLDPDVFESMLHSQTKVVAFTELSNVTGIRNPIDRMIPVIREKTNAWILVDGAQGVVHARNSIRQMAPDFYCFSGHKLGAPTGTGVLYIRKERMDSGLLNPVFFGGGTVKSVNYDEINYVSGPSLFEPGTPNFAGVIGLKAALEFWMEQENTSVETISQRILSAGGFGSLEQELLDAAFGLERKEEALLDLLEAELLDIEGIHVPGAYQKHYGCLSFAADGITAYDLCHLLDQCGVAVRSGHLCAQPYIRSLGYERLIRVSVAPYNTRKEIEDFVLFLRQILSEVRTISRYKEKIGRSRALSMREVEDVIIQELERQESAMQQFTYLVAHADTCMTPPEKYRANVYHMLECQSNTVVMTGWDKGHFVLFEDSDTVIVKGVLALIQEIYMDRTPEELAEYECRLMESDILKKQLSGEQYEGICKILRNLNEISYKGQKFD